MDSYILVLLAALAALLVVPQAVESEKILVFVPIGTKSHMNVYQPYIEALVARGHQLTVVSPIKFSEQVKGIHKDVVPVPIERLAPIMPNLFELRKKLKNPVYQILSMPSQWDFVYKMCSEVYEAPEISNLMKDEFDVVIASAWFPCFDGLIHKLNVPFIKMTTMAPPEYITSLIGNRMPWSHVPAMTSGISHVMTFKERLMNICFRILEDVVIWNRNMDKSEEVYRRHLGQDVPSVAEINKNMSLLLTNSHYAINFPRPFLPQVQEVGGMHCRPAKPVPKDLETFIAGAEHGVVYFSMGTVVKTEDMPDETRKKFLSVFAKLKERVVWKWAKPMEDAPPNVMIRSWLPQQDILGHKNVKLFITHGGLLSTQEAVYHGVPLLTIPVFADQDGNSQQAVRGGYALQLEIIDFTAEELENSLKELLENPKYGKKAKELSAVVRDEIKTPQERAVYWTEFVMRHKGAPQMRSAAQDLNFFEYHSLDCIAVIAIVLGVIGVLSFWILRAIVRCICHKVRGSKQQRPTKGTKKTN